MTIFLVRHGETEWNRARRYQGWLDSPLTAAGVAQAEAIGRRLRDLPEAAGAAIVSSPLGRARHTAEIIARCLETPGLEDPGPIRLDERLREVSVGSWDGRDRRELGARHPEMFDGDGRWEWYFRTPDGETYDAFAGRIAAFLADRPPGPLIAVCHAVVTRVLRGLYAGLPREEALSLAVPQDRIFRLAGGAIGEIAA